ncbi:hypothetical protein D1007_26172 [Hordeum vulgare]|nr:hypothetical protein D1007_26172 [Hordeum vulgare]
MCGFQAEGKGFFYIHDHSTPSQTTDRNRFIVISVVEGHASGRQLEEFFNAYINTNWRCSARSIGPNTFVMRFPSPRDVDKACFAESMNVKSCGVVINLRKWYGSVGAKGVLNVAWVNVGNIPLDKRHERNIAYVGPLVGVTLEIDKATINRPESVRIKLGCTDAEDIPASAEGVLGGHFYDFFFPVDKILVKNPPREKITMQQETEEGNTAKKARFNTDACVERNIASSSNMGESSAPPGTTEGGYGKNMVMNPVEENIEEEKKQNDSEEMLSEDESEEVGNELLIDTMVEEAEKNQKKGEEENVDSDMVSYDEIVVNSMQIVPSSASGKIFSSYVEACMGEPVVTEIDPNESSGQQKMQSYSVQSPNNSGEKVDVIPTPPVREEMQVRFSKRNVGANVEHMGVRAERMAQKRDLQGKKTSPGNSFEVLSNLEIISAAAQMGVSIPDDNF